MANQNKAKMQHSCRGCGGEGRFRFPFNLDDLVSAATLDGGIGLLLPMQEKTYRRLLMLQNALNTMLPHHAGLNPKAFRFVRRIASFFFLFVCEDRKLHFICVCRLAQVGPSLFPFRTCVQNVLSVYIYYCSKSRDAPILFFFFNAFLLCVFFMR